MEDLKPWTFNKQCIEKNIQDLRLGNSLLTETQAQKPKRRGEGQPDWN